MSDSPLAALVASLNLPPLSPELQAIKYMHVPSAPTAKFHTLHIFMVNPRPTSDVQTTLSPNTPGAPVTLTRFVQCTPAEKPDTKDRWLFAILDTNGLALSFEVRTPYHNGVLPEGTHDDLAFHALQMGLHHPFATTEYRVRKPDISPSCKLVPICAGVLDHTVDAAYQFFKAHFNKQWAARSSSPSQPARFWDAMEREFNTRCERLDQLRAEDGDLKWLRCDHCKGHGVIDRTQATRTPRAAPPPEYAELYADSAQRTIEALTAERDRWIARVKFLEAQRDEATAVLTRAHRSQP